MAVYKSGGMTTMFPKKQKYWHEETLVEFVIGIKTEVCKS